MLARLDKAKRTVEQMLASEIYKQIKDARAEAYKKREKDRKRLSGYDAKYREKNKSLINEKSRLRQAEWRKTDQYREWLEKSRERRAALNRKYRRAAGSQSRKEIAQRAAAKAAAKAAATEARRVAKADFVANFIGPPIPSKAMTDAEHYKWRIRNDPDFYAKELDRAQRYKARTRPGYKDSLVKWAEMPQTMKQVKHLQYLISRQLERVDHENDQRAA